MSDDITRAIDWVGCTTNSPEHAHEIRMDALKALADLRAERDEQKRRADYLSKDFDRDIKMYQAEVAELRADLAIIRPAVIEECAKVAEERRPMADIQGVFRLGFLHGGMEIANAIRALNKGGGHG